MVDDSLNIHGAFYFAKSCDNEGVICESAVTYENGMQGFFDKGDVIGIYRGSTMELKEEYTVTDVKAVEGRKIKLFTDRPVDSDEGDLIENLSMQPDITIENSVFAKANSHLRFQSRGKIRVSDCRIELPILLTGDASYWLESSPVTDMVIENCELTSNSIVLTGSGDSAGNGRWGTDIQVIGSKITGGGSATAIYHPQKNSTMTVYDSTIKGYNGITIKGGKVDIIDSQINGTGDYQEPKFEGNGFTDTGDAVYVETSYGYPIELNIQDSQLMRNHPQSNSLRVFDEKSTVVKVNIESGTFDEPQPEEYIDKNSEQITKDNLTTVRVKQ